LKSRDDHHSFVGTAPLGALAVTHVRGAVEIEPQPVGSEPMAVVL
jgi:hypothetical protein